MSALNSEQDSHFLQPLSWGVNWNLSKNPNKSGVVYSLNITGINSLIFSNATRTRFNTFVAWINMNYHLGIWQNFQDVFLNGITQIVCFLD